jgi:hypothetical protein
MSTPDDGAVPDTAMYSGSDAGEPGEHLGPEDLEPDERRLLEALERGVTAPDTEAPEYSELVAEAAEADAPLPAEGGPQDDGLSARFSEE